MFTTVLCVVVGVHDLCVLLYVFMTVLRVAVCVHGCSTCCCRCSWLFCLLLQVFVKAENRIDMRQIYHKMSLAELQISMPHVSDPYF